jgi:hypothetical protein
VEKTWRKEWHNGKAGILKLFHSEWKTTNGHK